MTSGTITKGALLPARAVSWPQGVPTNVGGTYGVRSQKVWSGVDSFPTRKSSRIPKKPLSSAIIAKIDAKYGRAKGPIEEVFYDGSFTKGRTGKSPNSWNCTFTTLRYPEGNSLFRRDIISTGQPYAYEGYTSISWDSLYPMDPPPAPVLTPDDEYKLIARITNQVRGNDFNASVAGSQSLQAVAMIGETASRIAKAISSAKKGQLVDAWDTLARGRKAKSNRSKVNDLVKELKIREYLKKLPSGDILDRRKAPGWLRRSKEQFLLDKIRVDKARDRSNGLDSLSSDWLALQYGWKPLLSDIHGAAELLAHQQNVTPQTTYRASISRKSDLSGKYWGTYTGLSHAFDMLLAQSTVSKRVIVELQGPPSNSQILGLQDPLSIGWELLPWSFVVDWFIPVGNYLEARNNVSILNVKRVITTTKTVRIVGNPLFKTYEEGPYRIIPFNQAGLGGYRKDIVTYERTISATYSPLPTPKFKPLSETLSFARAANSVALLRSIK